MRNEHIIKTSESRLLIIDLGQADHLTVFDLGSGTRRMHPLLRSISFWAKYIRYFLSLFDSTLSVPDVTFKFYENTTIELHEINQVLQLYRTLL